MTIQTEEGQACIKAMEDFYKKPSKDIGSDQVFNWIAAWLHSKEYYASLQQRD